MNHFLSVSGVSKKIGDQTVLQNTSFSLPVSFRLVIGGETGSGKSTLLKIICGLTQTDTGEVRIEGEKVLGPEERLIPGHPRTAYLSQHFELRNNYRVEEILEASNKMSDEEATRIYEVCQVDHLLKRKTDQLSGGERQRIATAMLLVRSPRLLLLDEPFTNLDRVHKQTMRQVIDDISTELNLNCILVSHDPLDILPWASEVMILQEGKIIQRGSTEAVYHQPVNDYTAGLLGPYNKLTPQQAAALGFTHDLLRPEQVVISDNGAAATIVRSVFYGSHYQLEVQLQDGTVVINAPQPYPPGSVVQLRLGNPS